MSLRRRRTSTEDIDPTKSKNPSFHNNFERKEMDSKDRTREFTSTIRAIESRQLNHVIPKHHEISEQKSKFTVIARKLSRDLAQTFAKLEKLTILAKSKSLFEDQSRDIQELTYVIRQDLNGLNRQIAQLQESKLASMSNNFKNVLEVRTESLKAQQSRKGEFFSSPNLPSLGEESHPKNSLLLRDEQSYAPHDDFAIHMEDEDKKKYDMQLTLIDQKDSYLEERASTMQNIESTIVELGQIFQQLAGMVHEQQELVNRIDSEVDDTEMNVQAAHSELLKYFQGVTSNRWLMIKVFAVVLVFFIIFVVFVA